MRSAWKYYFETVNGVIFVIDSADKDRMPDVRDELHQILGEVTSSGVVPLLILANKQDLPTALRYAELRDQLALCGDYEKRGRIRI
jgi:signal recognition particle receptor subunit beta